MSQNAIQPTRKQNYPEWYQEVIKAADLAENSPVRGCMVIKPWGYAIWENMQKILDRKFKETGHTNAYFPLLIPLSFLKHEAEHVDGFAKECAVVTHHRLKAEPGGQLVPDGKLEEPLVLRPTSETIIGHMFSRWVKSYRDLPLLVNQWCNVVRWEMRTRLFLRTSEFLWQEGHTVHSSAEEAQEETLRMLDVYTDFAENYMAMPVVKGTKTLGEKFPGAVNTYSIEAMMQDRKAIQAGTSHFLGQNFAKASNIKFLNAEGREEIAWTTSWGVSTRLIGGLIMNHSDDDGLILPPRLAPIHIAILPIFRTLEEKSAVIKYVESLAKELRSCLWNNEPIQIKIDWRDIRGGEKTWQYIKQGVPLRVEIGPRDIDKNEISLGRRDRGPKDKLGIPRQVFAQQAVELLEEIQKNIFNKAKDFLFDNMHEINTLSEFTDFFGNSEESQTGGFALCHWNEAAANHKTLNDLKVTPRCLPLDNSPEQGPCLFTGKPSEKRVILARAY